MELSREIGLQNCGRGMLVLVIATTPLYPNDLGQKCQN